MSVRGLLKGMKDVMKVDEPLSPDLQLTRTLAENQKVPVLFTNVNGAKVAGNLWSDRSRVASALGITKGRTPAQDHRVIIQPGETEGHR